MNIKENESNRRREIHEYLTTTHMFCFIVMMFALVLSKKMFSLNNYNLTSVRFLAFFAALLVGFTLITNYNAKNVSPDIDEKFTWIDFLYIAFPLVVATCTLFIVGKNSYNTETILLLPVIISSSILGKNAGLIIAAISTVIIYIENIVLGSSFDAFGILENNLILISVMFIVAWFVGVSTDLDNQSRRQLARLARTDLLTGLYNYGYFQEQIGKYVNNASTENPLALLMLDIDYFKHYNDIHGHQSGDLILSVIGDILTQKIPDCGFAGRYGGDDFVMLLPNTNSEGASKFAREIRKMVNDHDFKGREYQPEGKITVSCGIAICPTHARNAKDLINSADQALYRAKSVDKNKVEMYFSVFDHLDVEDDEKELLNSIRTLVSVINAKDRYTYGHSERVTENSLALAKKIGLPQEQIQFMGYAGFLHDIGKIEIDRDILNKSARLNKDEWEIIKHHPQWGSDIVKAMKKLHPIVPIILHHHENFDGSGYPNGLRGTEIPLLARIIRIADSYDAMISHRSYKKSLSIAEALDELRANAGTQFDPKLTECFVSMIKSQTAPNNL